MVNHQPEQPQNTDKNKTFYSFSDAVKHYMKIKKMTQSNLVTSSRLSKTTISRIYRNTNDKGREYSSTVSVVMAVSLGLRLNREQSEILLFAAFPEMSFWGEFVDKHLSVDDANDILYEHGANELGNIKED